MNTRTLGQTNIKISPIGLGTVKFGRNQGVKYPQGFEIPDESTLADLLSLAKDLGINTLDTAPSYGMSEERLGILLKNQRKDWVIVGKAGEDFENGESIYNFTPKHFEKSLERSLTRLRTDYIDILLVHSDGDDMNNLSDDLIAKLHDFKARGLVRAIGASTKTVYGGIRSLETMDTAMVTYNPEYTDEKAVLDYASDNQKHVLLKKALSSGHNTNTEDAFEFCFAHAGVASAIVGTINPKHLKENVTATMKALMRFQ